MSRNIFSIQIRENFVDDLAADGINNEFVLLSHVHSSPLNLQSILLYSLGLMKQSMKADGSNCVFGLKRLGVLIIIFIAPDMVENCSVEIMVEMVAEEMLLAADKTSTVTDKPGRATMNDEKAFQQGWTAWDER